MFEGLFGRNVDEELFNGCRMMKRSGDTVQYGFSTDVLYLDDQNQIGVGLKNTETRIQIRIEGVLTADQESLYQMLDGLVEYGRKYEYKRLHYGDKISDELLEMLIDYGFEGEKQDQADAFVLDFEIPEEVNTDECDRRDDGEAPTGG